MKINYRTTSAERDENKKRRDHLRDAARCINGPKVGNIGLRGVEHGPVVPKSGVPKSGGRCQRCLDVKKGVKSHAISPLPDEPRPPLDSPVFDPLFNTPQVTS